MAKVVWLTGISGAGKTTLGTRLKKELDKKYKHVELLDGETVRDFFEGNLGYTRAERIQNVKRIAFAAMLLAKNGTHVIVANIAPYYEVRDFIRKSIKDYIQVYLKVSLKKAIEVDTKGHYKNYKEGNLKNFIGLDDKYDVPRNPDLVLDTENETVEVSLDRLLQYLKKRGV